MSQITWRNVDAPDFTGALIGVEFANKLFNQALNSADAGIDKYRGMQTDAANRAIIGRMNTITDPVAYEEAMRQGQIIGPDSQNASIEMLQKAAAQGAVLTERAGAAEDLRKDLYTNARQENFNAAEDAFSPQFGKWQEAAKAGRFSDLPALTATSEFRNLDLTTKRQLVSDFQAAATSKQNFDFAGARERREATRASREALQFQREEEARADQEKFNSWWLDLKKRTNSPEQVRNEFMDMVQKGSLNSRQTALFASKLAAAGVETPYSVATQAEMDESLTGDPVLDAQVVQRSNETNNRAQQLLDQITAENTKLGSVGSIPMADYPTYANDITPLEDILKKVTGKGGDLEGADIGELRKIAKKYGKKIGFDKGQVSPATFFKIMKNNLVTPGLFEDTWDIGLGDKAAFDEGMLDGETAFERNLRDATTNDPTARAYQYRVNEQRGKDITAARAAVQKAQEELQKSRRLARSNPAYAAQVQMNQVAYDRAYGRLAELARLGQESSK